MCPPYPDARPLAEVPPTASSFLEEAQAASIEEGELLRKFKAFAGEDGRLHEDAFARLLLRYGCCAAKDCPSFFRAFDRCGEGSLAFLDFRLGCIAADPACTHVLNSFTGFERLQYAFDFYASNNAEQGGFLTFANFTALLVDCVSRPRTNLTEAEQRDAAANKATDLGILSFENGEMQFQCLSFKALYKLVKSEQLRGTSRLFRFRKGLAWPRHRGNDRSARKLPRKADARAGAVDEDCTDDEIALDQLLDMGMKLPLLPDEHAGGFAAPARRLIDIESE